MPQTITKKGLKHLKLEAADENTPGARLKKLSQINSTIAAIVASNAIAPPDLLRELARSKYSAVKKAVTGNPNTPTEILWELAEKYPDRLLENPVFELLLLENPNVADIPERTLMSLLRSAQIPASILKLLILHPDRQISLLAQTHVNFPSPQTVDIKEIQSATIATSNLRRLDDLQLDVIKLCTDVIPGWLLAEIPFWVHRDLIAMSESRSDVLELFALDRDPCIRATVARKSATPLPVLETLGRDRDVHVRAAVARNPIVPFSLLNFLSLDSYDLVLASVAAHINTPTVLLDELLIDGDFSVACQVVANPNCALSTLEKYSATDNPEILKAIASNQTSSTAILERLARHRDKNVRRTVAGNCFATAVILEQLSLDRNKEVREAVARNPVTASAILAKLAGDRHKEVRGEVATNLNTDRDTLWQLAEDREVNWKLAVLPNSTEEMIVKIARGCKDNWYFPQAARHPNFPSCYLAEVYEQIKGRRAVSSLLENQHISHELKQRIFNEVLNSSKPTLSRLILLFSSLVTPEILAKHSRSPMRLERYAIAQNPSTPKDILEKLATDTNRLVRGAAIRSN